MIAIQMNNKWQSTVLALVCQYGNYIHRFWFLDDLLCIIRFFQFSACFCSFFDLLDIIHYDWMNSGDAMTSFLPFVKDNMNKL